MSVQWLDGGALAVGFVHQRDRYVHSLDWGIGKRQTVLQTIEGCDADEWPASPPFQELHVQPGTSGSPVAFLVGRAGRSHWSASVEVSPGKITFDIACRLAEQPVRLGSSYAAVDNLAQAGAGASDSVEPDAEARLERWSPAQGVELVAGRGCSLWKSGRQLTVEPALTELSLPGTVRWIYWLVDVAGTDHSGEVEAP